MFRGDESVSGGEPATGTSNLLPSTPFIIKLHSPHLLLYPTLLDRNLCTLDV